LTKHRILIIDPDPATTKFLSQKFSQEGFETYSANSPKEGLILAYQHRPHVVVLDPILPDEDLNELLSKIQKDYRVSNAKIIAFSSLIEQHAIQNAINKGFSLYLAKEPKAIQVLVDKARSAAEQARDATASQEKIKSTIDQKDSSTSEGIRRGDKSKGDGNTIIFIAGKGGVGTTSLCANMAHIFAHSLKKGVTVVDLVLPIGSLASIVGLHDTINIMEAIEKSGKKALEDVLRESLKKPENWSFRFLAGSNNPVQSGSLNIPRIPEMIEALKKISELVIIDLGKSLSKISIPIIKSADQIVVILNLDQATVEQTSSVWNYLKDQGVQKDQVYFLINHSVSREGMKKSEIEEILGVNIPLTVPSLGRNFTLSNNLHQPILEKFPQDAATLSLRQAAEEILRILDRKSKKMEYY
jgi:MinD-like ATPase involved in chromosome partitioning or flagellar assembly/DNA-binding NarL/FixJ family response regulator